MPTNPIGSGTRNVSVNVPVVVHATLGRLAYLKDEYVGQMMRRLIRRELEESAARNEISHEVVKAAIAALDKTVKVSACILLIGISITGGVVRGARRTSRPPSQQMVLRVRASRKVGETFNPWEVAA